MLSRVGDAALALWGVLTFVFIVSRLLGDPAILLLPIGASEADLAQIRSQLGLDQPLYLQYFQFLGDFVTGDFGISFQFQRPALDVVLDRLPATALLALSAMLIGIVFGILAGCLSAIYRGTFIEGVVMIFTLLGQATPAFWLGIMMILFFAVELGWFPTGGADGPLSVVLPALCLATFTMSSIARLMRSSILEVMREDYVRTAEAKGLLPQRIFVWHIARNSLIPVVTMIGILTGELLGGAAVTETVFAWPGVGRLIVQAIEARDFPVVQAVVAVIALIFIVINLLIDLLYRVLDPRIKAQ